MLYATFKTQENRLTATESCTFIDEEKETKYNIIRYILICHGGMYKWQLVIKNYGNS